MGLRKENFFDRGYERWSSIFVFLLSSSLTFILTVVQRFSYLREHQCRRPIRGSFVKGEGRREND
jgi:hypothetical protein